MTDKDQLNKTDFDEKAATWDEDPLKVNLANDVADAMIKELHPAPDMDVLDYGCGSGLVTLRFQPLVKSITGMDSSKKMLEVLQTKVEKRDLPNVYTHLIDLEQGTQVEARFNIVVTSMTLHHVREPASFFDQLYGLLLPGGQIAVADLDKEDGAFHHDNRGVLHFGFERSYLKDILGKAGFHEIRSTTAATTTRPVSGKGPRDFTVFLITGRK
ncbi:MAG: SAM-dependent methyltransferase [Syntrophus sp. (in: bacteria)]|nr:SAM-dependent methyltransferase [Syntrophus sp. (in: bacteria)]